MKTIFKFIIVFYFSFIVQLTNELLSLSEKQFLPNQWGMLFDALLAGYTAFSAGLILFSIVIFSSSSWEYTSEKKSVIKTFSNYKINVLYALIPLILAGISFQYNLMMYSISFFLISISTYGFIILIDHLTNKENRND